MALVTAPYGNFMRISGTIAEVLTEIADQGITKATQISHYEDDDTDAVAVVGRLI